MAVSYSKLSAVFCHIKFQSIQLLMLYTFSGDPQFYGLEVSLSNILMIGLFRLNNRMVIFTKTEKKSISQQTRNGPYIHDVHMEVGWEGSLKICYVSADSFVFKQNLLKSIVHFCR